MTLFEPRPATFLLCVLSTVGCGAGQPSQDKPDSGLAEVGQCLDIRSYGGAGDDATDNAGPLAAAYAALSANGGCIAFPGGKFRFRSAVTFTFPAGTFSVSLKGAGQDATILNWPQTGGGLVFNYTIPQHSTHFEDLTLTTSVANGGTAVTLNQAMPDNAFATTNFTNVTIRGDDGGMLTDYWSIGVDVHGVCGIDFYDLEIYGDQPGDGTGVSLAGNLNGTTKYGLLYNITDSYFLNLGVGLLYGSYIQGVTVNGTNFQNGQIGIQSAAGETGALGNLTITESQFNTYGPALIQILSPLQVMITNSILFVMNNSIGIDLAENPGFCTIFDNDFPVMSQNNPQNTAIVIGPNAPGAGDNVIEGNIFFGQTVGIDLKAGSANTSVQSNSFAGVATSVIDNGSNDKIND